MRWLFAIWVVLFAILLAMRMQVRVQWPAVTAEAQATSTGTPTPTPTATGSPSPTLTPTATPTPVGPAMCSVSGTVVDAGGNPFINGTITFNSLRIQVINGYVVNPTVVTTNTDTSGNILAKAMPQGLAMQVTICPGIQQTSNCSAPFSVIIPFSPTANFGNLAQGAQLTGGTALSATTLVVSGATALGNPLTVGSTAQALDLTLGGTNIAPGPTQISSFIGINTKGPQIQLISPSSSPSETNQGSIMWGSPANAIGSPVGTPAASLARVSSFINATAGGGTVQPSGGLQFGTALGDGTSAKVNMELSRDGTLNLPFYAASGNFLGGPGTINVSNSYFINGQNQFRSGTFTPTILCAGGNPTTGGTGSIVGNWFGIGHMLFFYAQIFWGSATGGSGQAQLGGFPFPAMGGAGGQGGWQFNVVISNSSSSAPSTNNRLVGSMFNGESVVRLFNGATFGGDYISPLPCANAWANTASGIFVTGFYDYQ